MERATGGTNAAERGCGDREDRDGELAAVMAALAAGDQAAVITLAVRFEPELARAVRTVAANRGARLSADDVGELVLDAAIVLADLAGSWDAEKGAPPWVWARHRVAAVVDAHVGQHTRSLDLIERSDLDEAAPLPSAGDEPPVTEVLGRLAQADPRIGLLREAVERVASPRDVVLFLETEVQASLGDRSPAVTVGQMLRLRPEAVRQQHGRVRKRLQALAASDPYFADLADLAIVA